MWIITGWLGAAALLAGLVLGLMPIGDCGAPFHGADGMTVASGCSEALGQARQLPVALLLLGAGLWLGAYFTTPRGERPASS